jgi:hypothetical protein
VRRAVPGLPRAGTRAGRPRTQRPLPLRHRHRRHLARSGRLSGDGPHTGSPQPGNSTRSYRGHTQDPGTIARGAGVSEVGAVSLLQGPLGKVAWSGLSGSNPLPGSGCRASGGGRPAGRSWADGTRSLPVLTSLLLSPQIVRKTFESSQLEPISTNTKTAGQRRKADCHRGSPRGPAGTFNPRVVGSIPTGPTLRRHFHLARVGSIRPGMRRRAVTASVARVRCRTDGIRPPRGGGW